MLQKWEKNYVPERPPSALSLLLPVLGIALGPRADVELEL